MKFDTNMRQVLTGHYSNKNGKIKEFLIEKFKYSQFPFVHVFDEKQHETENLLDVKQEKDVELDLDQGEFICSTFPLFKNKSELNVLNCKKRIIQLICCGFWNKVVNMFNLLRVFSVDDSQYRVIFESFSVLCSNKLGYDDVAQNNNDEVEEKPEELSGRKLSF